MKRVLLVDDDDVFRDHLAAALRRRGYEVDGAADAAMALGLAMTRPPDAVVLDLRMPGEGGLELAERLRARNPGLRVVMLTGYGSIATAMQALRLGLADYLTKPADADQVAAAIEGAGTPVFENQSVPTLERVEWEHLQRVLADCGQNISRAARVLGIDRRSLQRKLAKFAPPR